MKISEYFCCDGNVRAQYSEYDCVEFNVWFSRLTAYPNSHICCHYSCDTKSTQRLTNRDYLRACRVSIKPHHILYKRNRYAGCPSLVLEVGHWMKLRRDLTAVANEE